MAKKTLKIDSVLGGASETQYNGSRGSFNVGLGIDPDFALADPDNSGAITAGVRTSGLIMPTRYEKFSSSILVGLARWMLSNPKNTNIYVYSDNPAGAIELASTSLFTDGSLVAYWKLENVNDSKASYNLTNNNTVSFAAAKFSNGADFGSANTDKSLTIANQFGISAGGSRSYAFWIKMKTEISSGDQCFFWTANSDGRVNYRIEYQYNSGTRRLVFVRFKPNVGEDYVAYTITLGTSDFYHLAITWDGSNIRAYVNGVLVGTTASTGLGTGSESANFHIGYAEASNYASCIIDDFAIFSKALSASEILSLYSGESKFIRYSSLLENETLVASPVSASGNGMAYYNNYIYIATNTDIGRYGPLDGSPSYVAGVWTGATLGTQPALINSAYPIAGSSLPNHAMHVHGNNILYVCDYNTVANPGKGVIHKIKTTKTTNEGDTNDGSDNDQLVLPFGFRPTDIESYGTDLVISAVQSTDNVIHQGRAALFFWDTTSSSFYRGPLYVADPLITAMKAVNGELYIWSGNSTRGCRLSKYIGGDSLQEIMFIEDSPPPLNGAVDSWGSRIAWGGAVSYPRSAGVVFSYGSKDQRLGKALMTPILATSGETTPLVASILNYSHLSFVRPKLIAGWGNGTTYGIDKLSTSATYASIWRSEMFSIGRKFRISRVRIPLAGAVSANVSITPKLYFDDLSSSITLTEINNTNYPGARKVVYHSAELNGISAGGNIGQDNFLLELNFAGTEELAVGLPIEIDVEEMEDENN